MPSFATAWTLFMGLCMRQKNRDSDLEGLGFRVGPEKSKFERTDPQVHKGSSGMRVPFSYP